MEKIIESILNGNCILFTGADFSKGENTINLHDENFLRGGDLAKKLLKECGEKASDNLAYASEIYLEKESKYQLINFLLSEFRCKSFSKLHEDYAKLPWKNIYTTNYDNILEKANPSLRPLTIHSPIQMHTYDNPFVLHINGYIETLNETSFNQEFKLTKTSYLIDAFNLSDWKQVFINDIKVSDYIIFIGYSLKDFDIEKILFSDEFMNQKIVFITSKREDKERDYILKNFGQVYNIGKEDFLDTIKDYQKTYEPEKFEISFTSFDVVEALEFNSIEILDEDIYNFFMFGKIVDNIVCKSILHKQKCCVQSESIKSILEELKHNTISLSSEMGNGKSIMVEMIKCYALQMGYKIFVFQEKTNTFDKEIDQISKCRDKHIIIIENYHHKIDVLEDIKIKINSNASILLTERTVFDEIYLSRVEGIFKQEIVTYDLNVMPDDELKELMNIFDTYGFAAHLKTQGSKYRQLEYLKNNLNRSLFLILLDLMKSPIMQEKAKYIFDDLRTNLSRIPENFEAFIALLILSILGRRYYILDFYDLMGNDVKLQNDFFRDRNTKQIISNENGHISIKSSILSNFILQNFIKDDKLIVKILLRIIHNSLNYKEHEDLAKELVNFSTLERILPKDKRGELVAFYQKVKEHRFFSNNPHFWLQYAIAMISLGEFGRAGEYFANAYAISERKGWTDTSKLDNHYARYLLDRNIRADFTEAFMEDFKEAHGKLQLQISEKSNHFFPFKVAINYVFFYNKYKDVINSSERFYIQQAIDYVVSAINMLPESGIKNNYFVQKCLISFSKEQNNWAK